MRIETERRRAKARLVSLQEEAVERLKTELLSTDADVNAAVHAFNLFCDAWRVDIGLSLPPREAEIATRT
jgi:hypothetical protein